MTTATLRRTAERLNGKPQRMARNPLQPGEIGKIRTTLVRPGLWRADASYCVLSGAKGRCRKSGRTEAAARRALKEELEERLDIDTDNGLLSPTCLVNEAVETYLSNRMQDARHGIGRANPRSVKIYRSVAHNWITPRLGELQVRSSPLGDSTATSATTSHRPGMQTFARSFTPPSSGSSCKERLRATPS